ncbi:hypothetical protein C8R45DRAFT_1103686 [Mycena sanguinolenta]|nr:hypothetical protein C8R45DRAFT_1103686 [Mycena sanguinolenta]
MGLDPANLTLRMIYGPLRPYVDFLAMAAEGLEDLHQYSSSSSTAADHVISDDEPRHASSLDGSLPSSMPRDAAYGEEDVAVGQKRKALPNDSPPANGWKRIRRADLDAWGRAIVRRGSTELTDREVTCLFAGVRLGILETAWRLEDIMWSQYEVNSVRTLQNIFRRNMADESGFRAQGCFPTNYVRHPLLHEYEAAKMQTVWYVLHRYGRYELADKLRELLSIRLRANCSKLEHVNAAYLEQHYPEADNDFYDLLRQDSDPLPLGRGGTEESSNDGASEASDGDLRLRYPDSESEQEIDFSREDPFICPVHAHLAPSTKYSYCFDRRGRILERVASVCYDEYGQRRPSAAAMARGQIYVQ